MGGTHDKQGRCPFSQAHATADRNLIQARLARPPGTHGQSVATGAGDGYAATPSETSPPRPIPETRLDPPGQWHTPCQSLHAPDQLTDRGQPVGGQEHRVGHTHDPIVGDKSALKHISVRYIATL